MATLQGRRRSRLEQADMAQWAMGIQIPQPVWDTEIE
jgi:hypothetical protein